MILSMTGYGDAAQEEAGVLYHAELRSVNNRYFKASIYLPEEFAFLEPELERLIRNRLTRGSITFRLHLRSLSDTGTVALNAGAVRAYVSQLLAAMPGLAGVTIDLATIATLPGVVQPVELSEEARRNATRIITQLAQTVIDKLITMRSIEGRALSEDLQLHCTRATERLEAIRGRAGVVIEEYRKRLLQRVQELLVDSGVQLAEEDLLKEVAIYADRSDISEEISRLATHLAQFRELLVSRDPAGRKLDFIAQEMLREANTIGSKCSDAQIARDTIEIKSAIDRIKEQVQNAE